MTDGDAQALAEELGEHIKAHLPAGADFVLVLDAPEARAHSSNLDRAQDGCKRVKPSRDCQLGRDRIW